MFYFVTPYADIQHAVNHANLNRDFNTDPNLNYNTLHVII